MTPPDLYYLLYASAATTKMSDEALVELLRRARENNHRLNVTGILLYRNGNFMQLLEGPRAEVKQLLRKIEGDPRHSGLMVLTEGPLEQRRFDEWAMAFKELGKEARMDEPGYSTFLETPLTPEEAEAQIDRIFLLLETFKSEM